MFQTPIVFLQSENHSQTQEKPNFFTMFQTPIVFLQSENLKGGKMDKADFIVSNPYRISTVGELNNSTKVTFVVSGFQTPIVFLQSENSPYVGL